GFVIDALHIPTRPDGALRSGQLYVAVPAAPLAVGADGPQRFGDIDRKHFRNFFIAQSYPQPPSGIVPLIAMIPACPGTTLANRFGPSEISIETPPKMLDPRRLRFGIGCYNKLRKALTLPVSGSFYALRRPNVFDQVAPGSALESNGSRAE